MSSSTEVPELNPRGRSGFMFWSMVVASLFYCMGFSSVGWESFVSTEGHSTWFGLWSTCSSVSHWYNESGWFKATQSMMTIGLILLLGSLIFIFTYMFFDCNNKTLQLKIFTALNFAAVAFMVIGFVVFGINHSFHLNWSFAFCVIGACICTIAGLLSIVQLFN